MGTIMVFTEPFNVSPSGQGRGAKSKLLGWEEKSKQPITALFDFANLPCPEGETLKGSVNTIIGLLSQLNEN